MRPLPQNITVKILVEKYPKIFVPRDGNPLNVNWYGVPNGWLPIIDKLCGSIQNYIDHTTRYFGGEPQKPQQVVCVQMKEKFGGLRFYTDGHDDVITGMIRMAEFMCGNTCDRCGSEEDLGVTSGWISIRCRTCAAENSNSWQPKNAEQ